MHGQPQAVPASAGESPVPQSARSQARGARAGHTCSLGGEAPQSHPRPWQRGQSHSLCGKNRVTACTAYSKWDFQEEVAGSANSPTDKAYLRTGVLVPMLCFYCQWDTAELDVPGARDRQPCPHTALMEQGPRPLPDPWEFGYTSGPKHSIFIVVSDITQSLKMHVSGGQLTWLWPTAITSLHCRFSGFFSLSQAETPLYHSKVPGAPVWTGKHSGCSQFDTQRAVPPHERAPAKEGSAGPSCKHREGSSGNFQTL